MRYYELQVTIWQDASQFAGMVFDNGHKRISVACIMVQKSEKQLQLVIDKIIKQYEDTNSLYSYRVRWINNKG